jgi:hypothetical protein
MVAALGFEPLEQRIDCRASADAPLLPANFLNSVITLQTH